jgi:hypothetical protein
MVTAHLRRGASGRSCGAPDALLVIFAVIMLTTVELLRRRSERLRGIRR